MYDFIVIGSGYGGIAAVSLLAQKGFSTLILESHTVIGGCASYYKRKNFSFDVGATTFSGVLPHQPLGRLFAKLNIEPKLKKVDPGLNIKIGDQWIRRYAEREKWIAEAERIFQSSNQRDFWNKLFELDDLAWQFIGNNKTLPPKNVIDFIRLSKISNLKFLKLFPTIFKSIKSEVEKADLLNSDLFRRFLEEQLLITTQNTMKDAPLQTSAMGLAYPSETYYPYGGMHKPAELMLQKFRDCGGEILFKNKVVSIKRETGHYNLKTARGKVYYAKNIISNIPIWNMAKITTGDISEYFGKLAEKFTGAWGSFTINFGAKVLDEAETIYYQIHTEDKIPNCAANSFFVSFSKSDDWERAPEGWRSVTISTHTRVEDWEGLSKEEYQRKKDETESYILKIFDETFEDNFSTERRSLLSGTPRTYEFYTCRERGFVGGIPHSVKKSLITMPPNETPFPGLYMVGDTVFPGQGTPAVVLGALNVVERLV